MRRRRLGIGWLLALGVAGPANANHLLPRPIEDCTTIEKPGSYRLTRTIRAPDNRTCIVIASDFVTFDLGGFALIGPDPDRSNADGIAVARDPTGIPLFRGAVVHNGTITGFIRAVDLGAGATVENMRIIRNDTGILVGSGSTVVRNTISAIVNDPLATGEHCAVLHNNFPSNLTGPSVGSGSTVVDNRSGGSEAGLTVLSYSTVSGNVATGSNDGLGVGRGSTVVGNRGTDSGVGGLEVGAGSTVANNTFTNGDAVGIDVRCPSNVIVNTAVGNESANLRLSGDGCNAVDNLAP